MTGVQALEARVALGVLASGCGLVAVSLKSLRTVSAKRFDRIATASLAASRVGLYVLVFFVLHIAPRGDIPGIYFGEALATLHGGIPYRDFPSSYAPLHPYLDAAAIFLWHSPLAIILLAIVAECFLLPIWLPLSRKFFSEDSVRCAALLYIASPLSLQFVAIDGQDNVIAALLLALATVYLVNKSDLVNKSAIQNSVASLSGGCLTLAIALVKFLPLIFAPLFFFASPRRWRWLLGFVLVLAASYGVFVLLKANILYPFLFEGAERTASNVPYLVESIFGIAPPSWLESAFLLACLGGCAGFICWRLVRVSQAARVPVLTLGTGALTLVLLLASRKSWPPYLLLVLFPLCLLVASEDGKWMRQKYRLVCFFAFNVIAVVAHSFWATVFDQFLAPAFHQSLMAGRPAAFLFLILQVFLVAGYLWLLVETISQIRFLAKKNFA